MTRAEALLWGRGETRRPRRWPGEVEALVTERQGGRFCPDCRTLGIVPPADVPLELDHLQPVSKGGDNSHANLRWACRSHNRGRGNRGMRGRPARPKWERRRK